MLCRAQHLVAMHNKSRSQRDMSHAVLFATGPWLLRDAFKAFTGEAGELSVGYAGEHEVKGTRIMVYSLGQWYVPSLTWRSNVWGASDAQSSCSRVKYL